MCEFVGDCDYEEVTDEQCSHYDGKDCRCSEKHIAQAEHLRDNI